MSLLSKLFGGDKEAEKAAKELLNGLFGGQAAQQNAPKTEAPAETAQKPAWEREIPSFVPHSGFSWGDEMPDEENQYNFKGTYTQYFESIFGAEFPRYFVEKATEGSRVIYTFRDGGAKALVVELLSEKSSVYKLRKACQKEGVPYLRFYYDHDGWWNTRAYVVQRVGDTLKG